MKTVPAKNVDAYIRAAAKEAQPMLKQMRKVTRAAAPKAKEVISYGMPMYQYHGQLVAFAAFKKHISIFAANGTYVNAHQAELKNYEVSKGTIHFPLNRPLPSTLIKKMVKERMKENAKKRKITDD